MIVCVSGGTKYGKTFTFAYFNLHHLRGSRRIINYPKSELNLLERPEEDNKEMDGKERDMDANDPHLGLL